MKSGEGLASATRHRKGGNAPESSAAFERGTRAAGQEWRAMIKIWGFASAVTAPICSEMIPAACVEPILGLSGKGGIEAAKARMERSE